MISSADRVWFVDPVQAAPTQQAPGVPIEILVTGTVNRNRDHLIGTIQPVTTRTISRGRLLWVSESGDYLAGAQIVTRSRGRNQIMGLVSDDLFVVGINGGEEGSGRFNIIANAVRSDGKFHSGQLTFGPDRSVPVPAVMSNRLVHCAPWAYELMPRAGDTQAVVDLKVAKAKQNFEQRSKKAAVYVAGMENDYLEHLDSTSLSQPTFALAVEGTILTLESSADVEISTLDTRTQERLVTTRSTIRPINVPSVEPGHAMRYVGQPFSVLTSLTANSQRELNALEHNVVSYAARDALRVHSSAMKVVDEHRYPILHSF